jgi:hypothetical protein
MEFFNEPPIPPAKTDEQALIAEAKVPIRNDFPAPPIATLKEARKETPAELRQAIKETILEWVQRRGDKGKAEENKERVKKLNELHAKLKEMEG